MGDTFGAWLVKSEDGKKHILVGKAYAQVASIARKRYGPCSLEIVSHGREDGETVIIEDDDTERTS